MHLMGSHAPDYCPESYALWFSYVLGDEDARATLEPFVAEGRRMTASDRDTCYQSLFVGDDDASGQDEVMRRLGAAVEQIERSVNGSLESAASLLDQLEQFSSSLSEEERSQFGEKVAALVTQGHEIQFMLGKSSGLLADSKDSMPEFSFDLEAPAPVSTGSVMSLTTILSGLHRLCGRQKKTSRSGALLVEIDGMVRITRDLPPSACNALVDEMARRILSISRPGFDIGRYEDNRLLLLVESASVSELEELADQVAEVFRDNPLEFGENLTRQITVSVGATTLTMEDFPEAVVGRLSRAVQRIAMKGGDASIWG